VNLDQTLEMIANQKEFRTIADLRVAVEVRAGEVRSGTDKQGRAWSTRMPFAYGRIQGTKGMDGENVDCILGPSQNPKRVWVIAMPINHGNEDKVMLGFTSEKEAVKAFLRCYQHKKKFIGHVSSMTIDKLKAKLVKRRGRRISAMFETSPWSNYDYSGFDPVSPRNTVPVENEGYDEDDPLDAILRKDKKNMKWYLELTRRAGAKTIAESAVFENWPHGGMDGLP
jgi:Inorganic Pyrophosphatase